MGPGQPSKEDTSALSFKAGLAGGFYTRRLFYWYNLASSFVLEPARLHNHRDSRLNEGLPTAGTEYSPQFFTMKVAPYSVHIRLIRMQTLE
ncbi:unnamed protein product [Penicillium roqueforti FM164]|uniref:Genomic scaffold, ProqFM164S01 n=1 Tax=Penicillium roqueforti (strain FM164) TaxID=1365484 RepID=W6QCA7_PENRF|nr:unnamed protein product [Penicillium roqueforti FM164]